MSVSELQGFGPPPAKRDETEVHTFEKRTRSEVLCLPLELTAIVETRSTPCAFFLTARRHEG
jgi:hypothetical protein